MLDRDIKAWLLVVIVVEGLADGLDCVEGLVRVRVVRIEGSLGSLTSCADWPSRKWFDEAGGVRVVDHSHRSNGVVQSVDQALHFERTAWDCTEIEDLRDGLVGVTLLSHAFKCSKAVVDEFKTSSFEITLTAGCVRS